MSYELRGEGLVWLIGVVVCLHAARGFSCSLARAMDSRVMHRGITSSCQSAATSKIVKALLVTSLAHVSSAIASTRPLPFYLTV